MSNIKTYTNFITEQVRRENTVGIRSKPISEGTEMEVHGDPDDKKLMSTVKNFHKKYGE